MQGPILNPVEQNKAQQKFQVLQWNKISKACNFSITSAFYLQGVGTGCRQSRPDLHLPTQAVTRKSPQFMRMWSWSRGLCSDCPGFCAHQHQGAVCCYQCDFLAWGTTLALVWNALQAAVTWPKGATSPLVLAQLPHRISRHWSFLSWMFGLWV